MNPIGIHNQGPLTPEQFNVLESSVREIIKQNLVGRRIIYTTDPLGFGAEAISYDRIEEMSEAQITLSWKSDNSEDIVNYKRITEPIPVIQKTFRINARSLAASRRQGTALDVATARSAAYQVALKEDEFIFYGHQEVPGLYGLASHTIDDPYLWSNPENIPRCINAAIGRFLESNIAPPYNLVLNPRQYAQALEFIPGAGTVSYLEWIQRVIKGEVHMSNAFPDGKALMCAAGNRGYFDIALGIDATTWTDEMGLKDGYDLLGVVVETLRPRVFYPEALLKLTNLASP